MGAHEIVDLGIALHPGAGLDLALHMPRHRRLAEDLAREPDAFAPFVPVIRMAHVIEPDHRIVARVGGAQRHRAARFGAHRPHMHLEAMALGHGLAIVAHRDRQEVILDVGIVHPAVGADEGTALELVRSTKPSAGEQPLRPHRRLAQKVPVFVKRYRMLRGILHVDF
jgi:hypothetical protein